MPNRVLLVENEAVQGETLAALLEARGRPCDWAANAEAALSRMAIRPYSALVVDQYMPGLDGVSLIRRVRDHAAWKAVPVVLLTAAASGPALDGIREDLALLQPAVVIQKPCGVEDVLRALSGGG